MDLFSNPMPTNILPYHGECIYYGSIYAPQEAQHLLNDLLTALPWENDVVMMFGKRIVTKRKTAWFGDKAFPYTYYNHFCYCKNPLSKLNFKSSWK